MALRSQRLACLALAAAVAAAAAPAAWGRPVEQFLGSRQSDPGGATRPEVRIVHVSPKTGFDWGDAEVGAGIAVGAIGAGGALVLMARRRPGRPAVSPR